MTVLSPPTLAALSEAISDGGPFEVRGLGTKMALGRSERPSQILDFSHFAGVAAYEPDELILEAGAATPLLEVISLLEEREQMLAFEPPDYSSVLGSAHAGSLGGILATGFAGPRRIKAGSVRDHVLGITAVSGRGEIFKGGARVVKNVTGYDVPKLMAGSWGTLAAMTSVIFKVLPKPDTEITVLVPDQTIDVAVKTMSVAMQSSAEVSAASFIPGQGTCLRLEGIAVSVAARREGLLKLLPTGADVLAQAPSQKLWASVRGLAALGAAQSHVIWRISVPPMAAPAVASQIAAQSEAKFLFDWAGGLIWAAMSPCEDAGASIVRGAIAQGHAMLFRASEALRSEVEVFQPQAPALAALSTRVKAALDPMARLNPGRMYKGI